MVVYYKPSYTLNQSKFEDGSTKSFDSKGIRDHVLLDSLHDVKHVETVMTGDTATGSLCPGAFQCLVRLVRLTMVTIDTTRYRKKV